MNGGKSTTHRMYINTISEKVRKLIQCLVLEEKILEIPGVNSLKVARDPEMIDAHFDPVVLYATLAGIKSADPVMRKVYLAHKSYFVNGIPMLAQPVSPLKGLGGQWNPRTPKAIKVLGAVRAKRFLMLWKRLSQMIGMGSLRIPKQNMKALAIMSKNVIPRSSLMEW